MRYNEETLKRMHNSTHSRPESLRSQLLDDFSGDGSTNRLESSGVLLSLSTTNKDLEMPMPPLALAPLQEHGIRYATSFCKLLEFQHLIIRKLKKCSIISIVFQL